MTRGGGPSTTCCCWRLTAPIARQAILRRRGVAGRRAVSGGREARPLHRSDGAVTVGQSRCGRRRCGPLAAASADGPVTSLQSASREDAGCQMRSLIGRRVQFARWNGVVDPVRHPAELRLQTRQSERRPLTPLFCLTAAAGHLQAWRAVQQSAHRSGSHRTDDTAGPGPMSTGAGNAMRLPRQQWRAAVARLVATPLGEGSAEPAHKHHRLGLWLSWPHANTHVNTADCALPLPVSSSPPPLRYLRPTAPCRHRAAASRSQRSAND